MRIRTVVALAVAAVALVGVVVGWQVGTAHGDGFLIGDGLDAGAVACLSLPVAAIALVVALATGLAPTVLQHPRRAVRTLAGIGLILGVAGSLVVAVPAMLLSLLLPYAYTEVAGVEGRDLVVAERGFLLMMNGIVFERDGIHLERLATFGADDGYAPFADGEYRVVAQSADEVVLAYRFHSPGSGEGWAEVVVPLR